MANKTIATIATMGIDYKNSFHVVGLDQRGAIVLLQKSVTRPDRSAPANMPPCLIGWKPALAHIT